MKVAVVQSNYIPWRGYFDLIASVDLFVIYDDVQYSKGSWRNRNQLKSRSGLRWITVPVMASVSSAIDEVTLASGNKPWKVTHRGLLEECLGAAPFFDDALRLWKDGVRGDPQFLSRLNMRLLDIVCDYVGIGTQRVESRTFAASGTRTDRLVDLLRKVGATEYLSGPSARGYIDVNQFEKAGIGLSYKAYEYDHYPQLWGEFVGTVSILDLIANVGTRSREYCRSLAPDDVVFAR